MELNKKILVCFCVLLCGLTPSWGQCNLGIELHSTTNEEIKSAELSIMKEGQLVAFVILDKPSYTLKLPSFGTYNLYISHMTHADYLNEIDISRDTTLNITMVEQTMELNEVVVTSKRSSKITSMERFSIFQEKPNLWRIHLEHYQRYRYLKWMSQIKH